MKWKWISEWTWYQNVLSHLFHIIHSISTFTLFYHSYSIIHSSFIQQTISIISNIHQNTQQSSHKHSFNSILHYTLLLSPLSIQIINPSFIHLLIYSTIHSLSFHIILSLLPFLYQSHHLHHIYSYLLYHLIIISILHFTYNFISLYTTSPFSQIYYLSTIHSSITLIHINYSNLIYHSNQSLLHLHFAQYLSYTSNSIPFTSFLLFIIYNQSIFN